MKQLVFSSAVFLLLLGRGLLEEDKKSSSKDFISSAQLLQFDDASHRVVLNGALLDEISALQGPLHVVTAIGDARIGKSTALNVMTAMLTTRDKKGRVHSVPPVFSVCESLETCTKGVWVHTLPLPGGGHMVVLDVEGTDLGGDLVTTQFSLLTSYLSSDVLIFLKESVPRRATIFLHELARLKERLKSHTSPAETSQMLYVTIRDPLKPPEDMSLRSYVSKALTNPTYCTDAPEECKLLERHFPLPKVNVYSLPYVSRRHQKSLDWTLKDKSYIRTLSSLTFDLKSAIDANTDATAHGQVFSGIVKTFMRTLQPSKVSTPQGGLKDACEAGDVGCQENGQLQDEAAQSNEQTISVTIDRKLPQFGDADENAAVSGREQTPAAQTGPEKVGAIDIEKIIKSPFETMGPGVYSFVMENLNRLRPGTPDKQPEPELRHEREEEEDDDDECSAGDGCHKKSKRDPVSKWAKAVRDFIDDIADALDDFFGSVMYE